MAQMETSDMSKNFKSRHKSRQVTLGKKIQNQKMTKNEMKGDKYKQVIQMKIHVKI